MNHVDLLSLNFLRFVTAGLLFLAGGNTLAAEHIAITTDDGRVLRGQIDSRTDSHTVWLRAERKQVVLTTAVPWEHVDAAYLDGKSVTPEKLRARFAELSTAGPRGMLTEFVVQPISREVLSAHVSRHAGQRNQVQALEIEAWLTKLDRTVEFNGLRLLVAPVDRAAHLHPVRGNVTARLLGQHIDSHTGAVRFRELERWNLGVTENRFAGGPAELVLPFRRTRPDAQEELCNAALLHVRLSAHGQGNFEASTPLVLREFNPFRDQLQYHEGSRFFRSELTRNTRQDGTRNYYQGFSPYWR